MTNFHISKRDDLQTIKDTTDGTVIYEGYANLGVQENEPYWSIKKIAISGSIIKSYYPMLNGKQSNDFNFKWSDRLIITYI